jgi:hypothetical protein
MKNLIRREIIDECRAAFLLELPQKQLRQICEMSGLGRIQPGDTDGNLAFTYEELYMLCRLLAGPAS